MTLYMNIKQIGKRRNAVECVRFTYEKEPKTLQELLEDTVKICVDNYIKRMEQSAGVLSEEVMENMAAVGKIAFGFVYGEKKPDVKEAVATAIQGFEDGLYRVFLGEQELEKLEEVLHLKEEDTVTFIRLTMLAGRMGWR